MQDFHFMTRMSKASPKLFLACANGQHMKEAKLVGVHGGAMQQEYLTWTFSDVLVSSYQTQRLRRRRLVDGRGVARPSPRSASSTRLQKADGSLDKAISAGWDLKSNKGF